MIYKQLLLNQPLPYIKQDIKDQDDLCRFFNDYSVLGHGKGDVVHFVGLYNTVASRMDSLLNMISQVVDPRSLTCVAKACVLCALTEIHYHQTDPQIMFGEYAKLLDIYGEDKTILYKLLGNGN